jgi:hypothetical protein
LSAGRLPTWLNEGLALYMENDADGSPKGDWPEGSPTPTEEELAHHRNDLFPLHALHGSFLELSQTDARLAYAESLSATRFLIRRYGLASLRRLLQMATTTGFEQAFEAVLREPYYQFESAWTASIPRQRM